jgi:hypothetical protein
MEAVQLPCYRQGGHEKVHQSSLAELVLSSNELSLTALGLARSMAEKSLRKAPMSEDTIWLTWSDELMRNSIYAEFLPLLDALWRVWR